MTLKQMAEQLQKPRILLAILLFVFFLKGLAFAAALPVLQGFDEKNHFTTAQYFSFARRNPPPSQDVWDDSPELSMDRTRSTRFNIQEFTPGSMGAGEEQFSQNSKRHDLVGFPQKYFFSPFARLTSALNWLLGSQSLLVRFFSLRILSVLLGVIIVYLVFLTARSAGLSEKAALLFAAIFSFQPVFTNVSSIINYDVMLTLAFVLFAYGAINLIRNGLSRKFFFLTLLAIFIGVFTKGTGVILAGLFIPVFLYAFQKKFQFSWIKFLGILLAFVAVFAVAFNFFSPYKLKQLTRYGQTSQFETVNASLTAYFSSAEGDFEKYSLTYWGNFGWINAPISKNILHAIWILELPCVIGLLWFFVRRSPPDFLPRKMIVFFLLLLFLSLQLGVRFADWRMFDARGHLILGTAGRYFIPALFAHLMILAIGIGAFFRREESFKWLLKFELVLMVLLYGYSMISVIIPRYYL